jgi:Regulator of ribonuclease activity B
MGTLQRRSRPAHISDDVALLVPNAVRDELMLWKNLSACTGSEVLPREGEMPLFKRKSKDDEPVDMNARSPVTGLKYKDIALLGEMMKGGADLNQPRHALYYLYFGSREAAEAGAVDGRAAGYSCEVREPLPAYPGQWSLVCERRDAVLDLPGVRGADDLFQGIADRLHGEFDGWEAAR